MNMFTCVLHRYLSDNCAQVNVRPPNIYLNTVFCVSLINKSFSSLNETGLPRFTSDCILVD